LASAGVGDVGGDGEGLAVSNAEVRIATVLRGTAYASVSETLVLVSVSDSSASGR